ncbi:MFS transporter [Streptomyces spiralis]|uniref:MFS transporter n=1 Tax=Streptomyces spiralis TaxID=66376 RepID=UPI0033F51088
MTTDGFSTHRSASRRGYWIALTALMLILFEQVAMGYAMVTPVLPALAAGFHTSEIAWALTAWGLSGAVLTPLFGKLADLHGKRRMLLIALAITALGSAVCFSAPNFAVFLVGRVLMGVSTTMGLLIYALMRDIFPKRYLGLAISVTYTGVGLFSIAAPFIAGGLNDAFGFHAVFGFLCGYPFVCAVIVLFFVPESSVRVHSKVDVPGLVLLAAGASGLNLGIGQGGTWGWLSPLTLACLIGGVVVLVLWLVYERARRDNHPLIEFDLLKSRAVVALMFAGSLIVSLASLYSILNFTLLQMPVIHGVGFGLTTAGAALWTFGGGIAGLAGGLSVGTLAKRTGFRFLLVCGSVFIGVVAVYLAFQHTHPWQLITATILFGLGGGAVAGVMPNLVVENVPSHQQGAAGGLINLAQGVGGSVWTQLLFTVMLSTVVTFANGTPVYNNASFVAGYLFTAACAFAGSLLALLIPRHKQQLTE